MQFENCAMHFANCADWQITHNIYSYSHRNNSGRSHGAAANAIDMDRNKQDI